MALLVTLALATAWPAWSDDDPETCQYVLVVDEENKGVFILNVGETHFAGGVGLDEGEEGEFQPSGVDFATVPEVSDRVAFLTQGRFLRALDLTWAVPRLTIDLESQLGLDGIILRGLDAAEPIDIGGELRYPLYVTGHVAGSAWVLVFDQEALIERSTISEALLSAGPLLPDCEECDGGGIDIAAGGPPAGEGVQEAYVSVTEMIDLQLRLKIYRLVLHDDFAFDVSLDPWNDEGVPFGGSASRVNGLGYDRTGTRPFGVLQTTSLVQDLSDGSDWCELPPYPNDVAVWGPDPDMENPEYLFVTSATALGSDLILGFPAGGCPDGAANTLSHSVSGFPRALALSSTTSRTPWVYTAHRFEQIGALHLELIRDSQTEEDRIEVLDSFVIPVDDGGLIDVAIRDEQHYECLRLGEWSPDKDPMSPKVDCDEDPDDPRCIDRGRGVVDFGQN
jgi:hypothetical protein